MQTVSLSGCQCYFLAFVITCRLLIINNLYSLIYIIKIHKIYLAVLACIIYILYTTDLQFSISSSGKGVESTLLRP